jgi:hypothetical protein
MSNYLRSIGFLLTIALAEATAPQIQEDYQKRDEAHHRSHLRGWAQNHS